MKFARFSQILDKIRGKHQLCEVVEIPEAPEARRERGSKGIEVTELLEKKFGEQQQYDETTTEKIRTAD